MAIDKKSDVAHDGLGTSGGTDDLSALLDAYANALETINRAPAIQWIRPEHPGLMRRLQAPAPSRLVRTFFIRHVSRCINSLKSSAGARAAFEGDASVSKLDLEMLEKFDRSLPTRFRLALIWPAALLGVLFVAYCLSISGRTSYAKLLGDFADAAVNLNRAAAIAAIGYAHQLAQATYEPAVLIYLSAAAIVALSASLITMPLLPAFAANRRLLAPLADLEARSFAALSARTIHDFELDLVTYLLQLTAVTSLAAHVFLFDSSFYWQNSEETGLMIGVILVPVTILAAVELRVRYAARRPRARTRDGWITRRSRGFVRPLSVTSLRIIIALSLCAIVAMVRPIYPRQVWRGVLDEHPQPSVWLREVGNFEFNPLIGRFERHINKSWYNEVNFEVTAIIPDAPCDDRPVTAGAKFLRFDLETWSQYEQFADPATAEGLSLRHWKIVRWKDWHIRDLSDGYPLLKDQDTHMVPPLYMSKKCSSGTEAISQPVSPGTHTKTVVVVEAPPSYDESSALVLDIPAYLGKWIWKIPPSTK